MLSTPDPKVLARHLEEMGHLPRGHAERFSGYAVLGVGFDSGDILALRRYPQSSLGTGYTSIWHCSPDNRWTIYADVEPARSCSRYLGRATGAAVTTGISLTWTGPATLVVSMEHPTLEWMIQLSLTPATRVLNALRGIIPKRIRTSRAALSAIARVSERALDAGRISLHGQAPNGQRFTTVPLMVWTVDRGAAVLGREDLGRVRRPCEQIRLGDFRIPKRGIFALAQSHFEPFDPTRHIPAPAASIISPSKSRLSTPT